MTILDGKVVSEALLTALRQEISVSATPPCVVFIRVGEDPASVFYVASKQKTAAKIGIESRLLVYPESITESQLIRVVQMQNENPEVHGILVQSPLPRHISEQAVFDSIDPDKDVDGLNSRNQGLLCQEDPRAFVPCTPAGCLELLRYYGITTEGKHAVVVGRSLLVGKPAALLLLQKNSQANATVTVCHSRTPDLIEHTRRADILIAAIGKPHLITAEMVKPGAVVLDVGINRVPDSRSPRGYTIVGDVDFAGVAPLVGAISPVPGGIGLMTVAMLMQNTVKAWNRFRNRFGRSLR